MADPRENEVEEVDETDETEQETETEEVETEERPDDYGEEPEAETEAETETETEEVEAAPPPKPPSRAQRRIQSLDERMRRLEAENAELKRRPAPVDPAAIAAAQRAEAEEDERVILTGDPGAISRHFAGKVQRGVQAQIGQLASFVGDSADRAEFRSACAQDPMLASVADDVEAELSRIRAESRGTINPKREALGELLLGRRMRARGKGAKTRQETRAAKDRQRETARPGNSRSDVRGGGRRTGRLSEQEARAKRLDESGLL